MKNEMRVIMSKQRKNISKMHELTGISRTTLSNIYHEKSNFEVETLFKLCDALKVTPNEFFGIKKDR